MTDVYKRQGLDLPESYPQVSIGELYQWRALPYAELAYAVLSKFIDCLLYTSRCV